MGRPFLTVELAFFHNKQLQSCKRLDAVLSDHMEFLTSLAKQLDASKASNRHDPIVSSAQPREGSIAGSGSNGNASHRSRRSVTGDKRKLRESLTLTELQLHLDESLAASPDTSADPLGSIVGEGFESLDTATDKGDMTDVVDAPALHSDVDINTDPVRPSKRIRRVAPTAISAAAAAAAAIPAMPLSGNMSSGARKDRAARTKRGKAAEAVNLDSTLSSISPPAPEFMTSTNSVEAAEPVAILSTQHSDDSSNLPILSSTSESNVISNTAPSTTTVDEPTASYSPKVSSDDSDADIPSHAPLSAISAVVDIPLVEPSCNVDNLEELVRIDPSSDIIDAAPPSSADSVLCLETLPETTCSGAESDLVSSTCAISSTEVDNASTHTKDAPFAQEEQSTQLPVLPSASLPPPAVVQLASQVEMTVATAPASSTATRSRLMNMAKFTDIQPGNSLSSMESVLESSEDATASKNICLGTGSFLEKAPSHDDGISIAEERKTINGNGNGLGSQEKRAIIMDVNYALQHQEKSSSLPATSAIESGLSRAPVHSGLMTSVIAGASELPSLQHTAYTAPNVLSQIASQVDADREKNELRLKTVHANSLETMRRGLSNAVRHTERVLPTSSALRIPGHNMPETISQSSALSESQTVEPRANLKKPTPIRENGPSNMEELYEKTTLKTVSGMDTIRNPTTLSVAETATLTDPHDTKQTKSIPHLTMSNSMITGGSRLERTPVKSLAVSHSEPRADIGTGSSVMGAGQSRVPVMAAKPSTTISSTSLPTTHVAAMPTFAPVHTMGHSVNNAAVTTNLPKKPKPVIKSLIAAEAAAKKEQAVKEALILSREARLQQREADIALAGSASLSVASSSSRQNERKPGMVIGSHGPSNAAIAGTGMSATAGSNKESQYTLAEHPLIKPHLPIPKPVSGEAYTKQKLPLSHAAQTTLAGQLSDHGAIKIQASRILQQAPPQRDVLKTLLGPGSSMTSGLSTTTTAIKNPILPMTNMPMTNMPKVAAPKQTNHHHLADLTAPSAMDSRGGIVSILNEHGELPEPPSDDSDSDDSLSKGTPRVVKVARWAETPYIRQAVHNQQQRDPDDIFGTVKTCRLDEIFDSKDNKRLKKRTSSAHWLGTDALSYEEEMSYKKKMGYKSGDE
ncbi:hypothetical protein BSLG_007195 [Batrachochytrium salamandrivorans]|nr:hypothetical protein BSLG_007195 [Batrachochytrium salamandrivorans]